MKGIADTGFLVAFRNRTDRYHAWAVGLATNITEPLGPSASVLALVEDGLLRIAFDSSRHLDKLSELARRYEDRRPDLADLCLIRMSELYPRHVVITVDEANFRVYRRNRGKRFRSFVLLTQLHRACKYSPVHVPFAAVRACAKLNLHPVNVLQYNGLR